MSLAAGSVAGVTIASGVVAILTGLYAEPTPPTPSRSSTPRGVPVPFRPFLASLAGGAVLAALSGWWCVLLLAALGGVVVPGIRNERLGHVRARRRVSAVASWVESVRDLLSAASGIEEAIIRSADTLPAMSPIKADIDALRVVTQIGGLREGLRRFGEALADPTVDYVCATLMIAAERSSGLVHEQLSDAATVAREQVAIREQVDASRSRMRTAAAAIVAVTVVMAVFIIGTQPTYATWYSTPAGQVLLAITGSIELCGMWWMARLARPAAGTRIVLDSTRSGQPAPGGIA